MYQVECDLEFVQFQSVKLAIDCVSWWYSSQMPNICGHYFTTDLSCSCLFYHIQIFLYGIHNHRNSHPPFNLCGIAYKDILYKVNFGKGEKRKKEYWEHHIHCSLYDWYLKLFGLAHNTFISGYFTGWISAIINM